MTELKPRKSLFNPEVKRRGIYVLPNLFTTAALFAGFFAIVQAMQGDFARAAMAIFIAMVLDGLDGRVARLTNTQSAFGAEYDSLSDMVSFGVAPSMIVYQFLRISHARLENGLEIGILPLLPAFLIAFANASIDGMGTGDESTPEAVAEAGSSTVQAWPVSNNLRSR